MPEKENYNLVEGFYILLNHKMAPSILEFLRQKTREGIGGVQWKDIFSYACDSGVSKSEGTIKDTLEKLDEHKLIEITPSGYRITLKGCWIFEEFSKILIGPQFEKIPESIQSLMTLHGWSFLLPAQREFIEKYFPPKCNFSILAPPSAGKTFLAECCIFEKLKCHNKVIYLTPYKALSRQKYDSFEDIFGTCLRFKVSKVDGDTLTPLSILSNSDIVVSTYERALGGVLKNEQWISDASLAIADEITLLNDKERGANLDVLLTLLKEKMQIITLSSNIGNREDLCRWHGGEFIEYPQDEFVREFIVKQIRKSSVLEDKNGSEHIVERTSAIKLIFEHMSRKPNETVLILVGPRARTESLSLEISREVSLSQKALAQQLQSATDEITPLVKRLSKVLEKGIVFHHAGLRTDVRDFIEDLLNRRAVNTVVATTTLSHGVDFPIDYIVIFLDTFEFKKRFDDWDSSPALSKLEYLQYRGRAARFGRSKKGDVYIVSDQIASRTIEKIRRDFLAKKIECLQPSTLTEQNLDWIVLSICKNVCPASKEKIGTTTFDFIQKLFYFQTLDKKRKNSNYWKRMIGRSVERLNKYGFLNISESVNVTSIGRKVAEVNMTPRDSLFVIANLEAMEKSYEKIDTMRHLLAVASGIGLLRNFNGSRLQSFVLAYRIYCKAHKEPVPISAFRLRCEAKAWILNEWMEEESLSRITSDPAFKDIVYDDDVPRLGHYASMEMRKISSLAKILRLNKVTKLAEELVIRLNRGTKSDLVSKNPDVDLFNLESIGRRKARILYNHGYGNLLDIFSRIFSKGDNEFIKSSGLTRNEALHILADLKRMFKENGKLKDLCKDL